MIEEIGSLIFWQDERGKLPVRFGILEGYDFEGFKAIVRSGRTVTTVENEKVKFVGSANVVD